MKAFAIYMSVKACGFYLLDAECTILWDDKPIEKFLQGKTENQKDNVYHLFHRAVFIQTKYTICQRYQKYPSWLPIKTCRCKCHWSLIWTQRTGIWVHLIWESAPCLWHLSLCRNKCQRCDRYWATWCLKHTKNKIVNAFSILYTFRQFKIKSLLKTTHYSK